MRRGQEMRRRWTAALAGIFEKSLGKIGAVRLYFAVSVKSERVFCVKLANEACKMTKTWYDRNMKNAFFAQYEAIWMLRWNENRSD